MTFADLSAFMRMVLQLALQVLLLLLLLAVVISPASAAAAASCCHMCASKVSCVVA
jgi:hypothetical protein